jgi:diadenosine tetraphosphate (Ap4A) HIT family hydrolase
MSKSFRYAVSSPPGFNSHIGDVEPGGVYEVPAHLVPRFERAKDWEPVNSKSDAQTEPSKTKRFRKDTA